MSKSANLAFHLIAVQKHVLPKARLDLALKQADAQGVAIEGYLLDTGNLDLPGIERIVMVRERHGRVCGACAQKTYLLPGETLKKPCEHCGGALLAPKPAAGDAPAPAAAPDAAAVAPAPATPTPSPAAPAPVTPAPDAAPARPTGKPIARPTGSAPRQRPAAPPPETPAPGAPGDGAPPRPAVAHDGESEEQKKARLRRLRQIGGGLGSEPPVPVPAPAPVSSEATTVVEPTPTASDYLGGPAAPSPTPAVAHADETPEQKQARLRRLRQVGGGLGFEPVEDTAPAVEPPAPVAPFPRHFAPPTPVAAGDPPPLDDALFMPPPRAGADDDARFGPPAAHRAAAPAGLQGIVDRPTRPLAEELGTLLGFPGSPFGLFMVSAGAALLFLISAVVLNPIGIRPLPALLALIPLLLYIYSYLVVVTETASQGREELPDWPDLGAAVGLGWRMFLAYVASFAPALVVFCIALKATGGAGIDPKLHPTVGPDAVNLAGEKGIVAPGTSARDAAFVTLDGNPVPLGGKWTIVGLLGKDTADDTGTDEAFASMPSAGMGVVIDHAAQIHDLDRVGRALKEKVTVYAAFADPRCKIVWGRHPYAVPDSVRQERHYLFEHEAAVGEEAPEEDTHEPAFDGHAGDDEELGEFDVSDETAEGLRRVHGTASKNAIAQGGPAPRAVAPTNPFRTLTFIRTDTYYFPPPFQPVRILPAVYVLDPQGVVRREYTTGVDDRKLYGDLLDLLSGGDGDGLRTDLPPSAYGITAKGLGAGRVVAGGLVLLLIGFGVFYLPMALLLMVAFNDGAMAFQYPAGLRAIGAATKDYLVVAGLFVGTTVIGWVVSFVATFTISKLMGPILGWAVREYVNHWIWFYGALVSAYAVGRFYYRNRETIGWFNSRR